MLLFISRGFCYHGILPEFPPKSECSLKVKLPKIEEAPFRLTLFSELVETEIPMCIVSFNNQIANGFSNIIYIHVIRKSFFALASIFLT